MSTPGTWEAWIDGDGAPAGAETPADFADQLALHRALVALHGDADGERRLHAAVRAALRTDSGRWRRRLRRDPRLRQTSVSTGQWWLGAVAALMLLCAGSWWATRPADPRPVVTSGSAWRTTSCSARGNR